MYGTTIHSSDESPDMYASIDAVSDRLSRKLRNLRSDALPDGTAVSRTGSAAAWEKKKEMMIF
jgi:hypothetical protein